MDGRGIPHLPCRFSRGSQISADREHSWRAAQPARARLQFQKSSLLIARLGDLDGELSWNNGLWTAVYGCGFRRSELQRSTGCSLRCQRCDTAIPLDRPRPHRRGGNKLRRAVELLAHHSDQHVQSRDPNRSDHTVENILCFVAVLISENRIRKLL